MSAQDPNELFDLVDRHGEPLGVSKPRSAVHRDGDWHRSLHLWVVLAAPGPEPVLVLQRRSAAKDTWPGAIDVAVAGHYRAGERLADVLREAEEEIGLRVSADETIALGTRVRSDEHVPGVRDNEVQDIRLAVVARALSDLRPHPDELEAVLGLPLSAARRLLAGEIASALGMQVKAGRAAFEAPVRQDELVAAPDGYYARAIESICAVVAGEAVAPFRLAGAR